MALLLCGDAVELHGPAANVSTLLTTSPVLAVAECAGSCGHFDRYEGELLPEHPTARIQDQPSLDPELLTLAVQLTPVGTPRYAEPATEELLLGQLLPARAPPAA